MKTYWDSSALVATVRDPAIKSRLENEGGFTRTHALAETFSALTGNACQRVDANDAAVAVARLSQILNFVDLTPAEIVAGLKQCRRLGVRGGRVHDYLHALAAEKCGADKILTLDRNDFTGLGAVPVEQA